MSSGRAKTMQWVLEYKPVQKNSPEPLMGWNSGGTVQQIRVTFESKEEAIAYAHSKEIPFEVIEPKEREFKPKSYSANFAYQRKMPF